MKSKHGTWQCSPTWTSLSSLEIGRIFALPSKSRSHPRIIIGRSEWLALPELRLPPLRAKSDTGAKTSTLHAENITVNSATGIVDFVTRTQDGTPVPCSCHAIEVKRIRNSGGICENRVVIRTVAEFAGGIRFSTEFTLADRSAMKHPLLLGRSTLNGHFFIDPQARNLLGCFEHLSP